MNVTRILFSGCTGFGDLGRAATLFDGDNEIGIGYGATDDEAVLEALTDVGFSFDNAFDMFGSVTKSASCGRQEGCPV